MTNTRRILLGSVILVAAAFAVSGLCFLRSEAPEVELCLDAQSISLVSVTVAGQETVLVSEHTLVKELIELVSASLRQKKHWHSFTYCIFGTAVLGDEYIDLDFVCNARACPSVTIDSDGRLYVYRAGVFQGNRKMWSVCESISKGPPIEN